jgi:hypothetical protein
LIRLKPLKFTLISECTKIKRIKKVLTGWLQTSIRLSIKIMQLVHLTISPYRCSVQRIALWLTVGIYTAALSHVVIVFREIERHVTSRFANNIPFFIIAFLAVIYALICLKKERAARGVVVLTAAALIVLLITFFEANPNKYIHIPEYVLMTWILYLALAIDYRGRGILLLVLICAAMLGVVDELIQGIHPQRTFGWKDMTIDSASSVVGILTLAGVKNPLPGNWKWLSRLKYFKGSLIAVLFGMLISLPMCFYLFQVQAQHRFSNVYPLWLLTGNLVFLIAAVTAILVFQSGRKQAGNFHRNTTLESPDKEATALLWVMSPLSILIGMHSLVGWAAVTEVAFR